jgi:DNA (cytosine-5)-methyltransferase 1
MTRRKPSDLTVTDQFCGAGGSSIGVVRAGARLRMALNHWKLAIETHNTNFPDADHDCTDVSACDPRRYPSTDILITSPECTTHSPAGGSRKSKPQRDLFSPQADDPALTRSRATMWDVPRFAEFHQYNAIIVENVIEAYRWPLFATWLEAMHILGYEHRIVCMNSMFAHPTPQSRDRLYVVFWKKGNRAPKLDFRPPAFCHQCERQVRARQTWKNGRTVGKYRQQYIYTCPECRREVLPYYYAALNAIDFSLPAERIGDRNRPLKPRTLERIRYGLERYGRQALLVTTNQTTDGGRVRILTDPHFTQTASWLTGFVQPVCLVDVANTHSNAKGVRGLDRELGAVTTQATAALVGLPFFVTAGSNETDPRSVADPMAAQTGTERFAMVAPFIVNGHMSRRVHGVDQPLGTQSACREHDAVLIPAAAVVANRAHNRPRSLADPISTIATGGHQMLVHPAALMRMQHADAMRVADLSEPTGSMVASCPVDALISRAPFIASQFSGGGQLHGLDEPSPTHATIERHALVSPDDELKVEDCYFRMLQPHEIGAAMAFPDTYVVLGNKRDKVKQFGNAVTPPAMEWLFRRAAGSLHSEMDEAA